ncbi:MAG TPA: polynucleotide adenylyltransferase PcnB [Thermoanaerobaculia bacterium]|nr:polynucleotide adenylyltransferase PcnB [Thermoanaerobaculia bacterium]
MDASGARQPRILARAEHPISRKNISDNALKVLYRLHGAGFKAYLVGGSVRDLMLGRQPKDFDAATDARPNEIRRLFRNSRLIGRRFRLVHVFFKDGVVEVSTFRKVPDPNEQEGGEGELLITSDNTFGSPEEDAFRRDFTVNALFYSIEDFSVIDYVGGVEDLENRVIRVIGDPDIRFREDPVRMMRACEFAARLGFGIEPRTQEAIDRHRRELAKASPARLTDELLQLLRCGHSGRALQWMLELGLLEDLLPETLAIVSASQRRYGDFSQLLPTLDRRCQAGEAFSDVAVLAVLLLPAVLVRRFALEAERGRAISKHAGERLIEQVVEPFVRRFALSKARAQGLFQALSLFQEFGVEPRTPAERVRLARRPSFGDALALLAVLVEATGEGAELLALWRQAYERVGRRQPPAPAKDEQEEDLLEAAPERGARRERRRRRRR